MRGFSRVNGSPRDGSDKDCGSLVFTLQHSLYLTLGTTSVQYAGLQTPLVGLPARTHTRVCCYRRRNHPDEFCRQRRRFSLIYFDFLSTDFVLCRGVTHLRYLLGGKKKNKKKSTRCCFSLTGSLSVLRLEMTVNPREVEEERRHGDDASDSDTN